VTAPSIAGLFDADVERALRAAARAHCGQVRKGTDVPYVLHPIHCAMVLARLDFPSRVIQAALLHDVVEDCKDRGWDHQRVALEFGAVVAGIVAEVTEDKSRSWKERKQAGIDHVPDLSADAVAVKAADKLHNLRTLATDLEEASDRAAVWARFNAPREDSLAMSRGLVDALAARADGPLAAALRAAMDDVERLAGA
jgi:(p)ppGpp synthase/HD superfamily hydrolase